MSRSMTGGPQEAGTRGDDGRRVVRIEAGGVNCYLVPADEGWVLIDSGFARKRREVVAAIEAAGCGPGGLRLIVITHADSDHVGNAAFLRERLGAPVAMHEGELEAAAGGDMMATRSGLHPAKKAVAGVVMPLFRLGKDDRFAPDVLLHDGDRLDEYGLPATVLHLAGHSRGSVAVLTDEHLLFCGDVLENRRRPRPATLVDDPGDLRMAVARLRGLETGRVYPGHGAPFHMDELREGG